MSSLPGLTLEDYVAWNYDLVVYDQPDANFSLAAAEILGTIPTRRRLTQEQFAKVVGIFEPYRERIEDQLYGFDDETMSWRDYAGVAFEFIPQSVYDAGMQIAD